MISGFVLRDPIICERGGVEERSILCGTISIAPTASIRVANDCQGNVCQISSGDGIRNGTETDIDCGGGGKVPACSDGKRCAQASDCESLVCVGKICQTATHTDETKNLDETGIDCGGPDATSPRCVVGQACVQSSDCALNSCNRTNKVCQQPAINGIQDGTETDVDCGGDAAPACDTGKTCVVGADCKSLVCNGAKKCVAANNSDGVKNGDESDVDCGGTTTNAPKCAVSKACNSANDCGSDSCDYNKKCTSVKSCAVHFGGDTCGSGEVGNANAQHESCCKTIPLNATTRLEKYAITAGRIREFINKRPALGWGWWRTRGRRTSTSSRGSPRCRTSRSRWYGSEKICARTMRSCCPGAATPQRRCGGCARAVSRWRSRVPPPRACTSSASAVACRCSAPGSTTRTVTLLWQGNWSFLTQCDRWSQGRVTFACQDFRNMPRDFVDNDYWLAAPGSLQGSSNRLCGRRVQVCKGTTCRTATVVERSVEDASTTWEGSTRLIEDLGGDSGFSSCTRSWGTVTGVTLRY